ncbi:Hypothetical protein I595_66 [Croceitalea dokdonensis DOKDO 023]|uniref:Uncharacterized protein n=1 Tax=Croceitalea dokdonensis DOKDO 023 TaxID=1300341 RepID=A0A0N8H4E7_9FLAO|nr:hypothetical protein [Croceitalea dokdonensis]KPM33164.1 Hypothetical protein I595_66 [Croceitalea dokdonensis DOKDO 023]
MISTGEDLEILKKKVKSLKIITIAFGFIWLFIIVVIIWYAIDDLKKDQLEWFTLAPALFGPITMLPLYMVYISAEKDLRKQSNQAKHS